MGKPKHRSFKLSPSSNKELYFKRLDRDLEWTFHFRKSKDEVREALESAISDYMAGWRRQGLITRMWSMTWIFREWLNDDVKIAVGIGVGRNRPQMSSACHFRGSLQETSEGCVLAGYIVRRFPQKAVNCRIVFIAAWFAGSLLGVFLNNSAIMDYIFVGSLAAIFFSFWRISGYVHGVDRLKKWLFPFLVKSLQPDRAFKGDQP